jgi:P pilus assembly protein, porin PapC
MRTFTPSVLTLAERPLVLKTFIYFLCPALVSLNVHAAEDSTSENVEFNTSFLNTGFSKDIDLKNFSKGSGILPGKYLVDVYQNNELVTSGTVTFIKQANGMVEPCLSSDVLAHLNVMSTALKNSERLSTDSCVAYHEVIPSAHVKFDGARQALMISIPQQDMQKTARGAVSPVLWQYGSTAAFLSYNANAYQARTGNNTFDSQYLSLNSGINIGGWYFRHNGSLTQQTDSKSRYQSLNTYVQHDLTPIKGRLVVGQSNTSGRQFDTVPYAGVSVFSDDQMLPESQRGYAPEVRGIARSNARVTVRQGGNVIYETSVPAGAFVINDLYPTGYGGDLQVTVRESDGSESSFLVPYASVTDLLRPGAHRYEAVAGRYRAPEGQKDKPFYQGTWQQGITNSLSLYTGFQLSDGYQSYQLGSAVSTPLGALALDVTQATTKTVNDTLTGQSYKVSYNKLISDTNSNIALAAYRFSTRNYLDFTQAVQYQNYQNNSPVYSGLLYRAKNRYSVTLSQGLAEGWGSVYASGIAQNYWNRSESDVQYQLGYSNRWNSLTYSLTASRSRSIEGSMDTSWLLSLSVPLGESRPVTFSTSIKRDYAGNIGEQASLSGTAGQQQQLSWNVSGSHDRLSGSTGGVGGQYISPWTTANAAASFGQNSQTYSAGIMGAIVAHPHGVTLTPYTGDTWVVAHAPGASGADVTNYPGIKIDRWGNAAIPSPQTYQRNNVGIDPNGLSDDIELEGTTKSVVPRSGSVVIAEFESKKGEALLMVPAPGTTGLPFGTNVTDSQGNSLGLTGQGGMLYARVEDISGKLYATVLKQGKSETCIIPYKLEIQKNKFYKTVYTCN